MNIANALAGIAVRDFDAAVEWYGTLFSRKPDAAPMPHLAEWHFVAGGWLQVFEDRDRAGQTSVTLVVDDISTTRDELLKKQVDVEDDSDSEVTRVTQVRDPDGNLVVFAQSRDAKKNPSAFRR